MTGKLNLTFGNLIAHFIPGFVTLLAIVFAYNFKIGLVDENTINLKTFMKDSPAIFLTVVTLVSLAFGLILDAFRYLLFLSPQLFKYLSDKVCFDISSADEDGRKFHDWIIEHHYRFHQFYGNLCLGIWFSTWIINIKTAQTICQLWPFYLIGLICAVAAFFTYVRTIKVLKIKFPKK